MPLLSDVARDAGVSMGTASKALNGQGRISEETRQRVQQAAQALGFRPNIAARHLQQGRTGSIGLLTNDLEGRFSLPILMGVEDALGAGNHSVLLCDARGDAIRERFHLDALMQRRVDGLIVVGERAEVRTSLGVDLPIPVVYAYAPSDDPRDYSVVSDDVQSARLAARHVLELGRRRIAYIGGDPAYSAARRRGDGVAAELTEWSLTLHSDALFGSWTEEWGRAGSRLLLERAADIDAIICGNDQIARGALDTLHDADRDVPGSIAVVGHDNWEPIAAHARPPLTSLDMNLKALGRRAAKLLFEQDDPEVAHVHTINGRIVIRDTTA